MTSTVTDNRFEVLPLLAEQGGSRRVQAILVEFDPIVAQDARKAVANLGLSGVEVITADAGAIDTYCDLPPAQILTVCGVFGNITKADMQRTVATLPALLSIDGIVVWTRAGLEPSLEVRSCFLEHGFTEMSFTSTADDAFRIGMHRLTARPADIRRPQPGTRMFSFV